MQYDLRTSSSQNLITGIKKAQNFFKWMSNEKKAKQLVIKNVIITLMQKRGSFPTSITYWQRFFGE
jgi:hypothetical protein